MIYLVEGRAEVLLLRAADKAGARAWLRRLHGDSVGRDRVRAVTMDELSGFLARGVSIVTVNRGPAPTATTPAPAASTTAQR